MPGADGDDADLRRLAEEQFQSSRFVQAVPLFEKLVARHGDDAVLQERLGFALLAAASALEDPAARHAQRQRGRAVLLRARDLGDDSNLLKVVLEQVPEDGSESAFSANASVDTLMRNAENAFAHGDMDKARTGYLQALLADPNLYEAPLFLGDVCYKLGRQDEAGEWYARAIQIDPNRETAYRYWGDALMAAGQPAAARERFIDAVIAEPYGSRARVGLSQWADRVHVKLAMPDIQPRASVRAEPGKKATIVVAADALEAGKDEMAVWLIYAATRALWIDGKFAATYPEAREYRHSLAEEAEALRAALLPGADQAGQRPQPLVEIERLAATGLVESYVLLFRADDGIAQDYAAYRAAHRDLLRRLLDEVVVPKLGPQRP